ncbi:hypothetical protein E4U60_002966 [Claviceps pazoutovae]|uniref:Uncharacterized protein n=1 Tax=Claviceps pazoutovae TaxID=1649127 RepID=A0A9P7MAH8_9HYPO|nr:hypothetical protein E4U60_002966 [Claviceps pazoutovae]
MTDSNVAGFKDALRIYRTNGQVNAYNRGHMEKIQKPIINIACTSTGRESNKAASRDAGNLQQQLNLCVGAKVILADILWTPKGLVNGAIGTIVDFAWKDDTAVSDLRKVAPTMLVHFDSYKGPPVEELVEDATLATNIAQHFGTDEQARLPLNKIVPIFRSRRDFFYKRNPCTRTSSR